MSSDTWFLYILSCSDGSLYTGITNNLKQRVKVHNTGKGSKYTRSRLPVLLIYSKKVKDRSAASKLEWKVKQMSRTQKLALIESKNNEKTY